MAHLRYETRLTRACIYSATCEELERECGITLSYVAAVGDRCATHSHARARTRARPLSADE